MKPNIELAKKLLKEKYSITEDGKEFKLQYPIYVEDLAFIMQKYTENQLDIDSVGNRFLTITEALGYLNRSGHTFKERIMLSDETIILIANEIFKNQQLP